MRDLGVPGLLKGGCRIPWVLARSREKLQVLLVGHVQDHIRWRGQLKC